MCHCTSSGTLVLQTVKGTGGTDFAIAAHHHLSRAQQPTWPGVCPPTAPQLLPGRTGLAADLTNLPTGTMPKILQLSAPAKAGRGPDQQ